MRHRGISPLLAALLLTACAADSSEGPALFVAVPLTGSDAELYRGRWYTGLGELLLLVEKGAHGHTAAVRHFEGAHPPVGAEASGDSIRIWFEFPDEVVEWTLERVEIEDEFMPPGSDLCLMATKRCIDPFLFRDPAPGWHVMLAVDRYLARTAERLDSCVDWAVRRL